MPDRLVWQWTSSGAFLSSSTYYVLLLGQQSIEGTKELWKVRAPSNCKFFVWLTLLCRSWTFDRLQRHGLQNNGPCALCSQKSETISHMLVQCVFSREIWFKVFMLFDRKQLCPAQDDSLASWWLRSQQLIPKGWRNVFDSMVVLVCWGVWLQRNDWVFVVGCSHGRSYPCPEWSVVQGKASR
jgi:hypothetical protein